MELASHILIPVEYTSTVGAGCDIAINSLVVAVHHIIVWQIGVAPLHTHNSIEV